MEGMGGRFRSRSPPAAAIIILTVLIVTWPAACVRGDSMDDAGAKGRSP